MPLDSIGEVADPDVDAPQHVSAEFGTQVLAQWNSSLDDLETRKSQDTVLRSKNLIVFILALIGVVLMIWDEELRWEKGPQYEFGVWNNAVDVRFSIFDVLLPLCNCVLVWRLVDVYWFMSGLYQRRWGLESRWTAFRVSFLRWKFLAELLICVIQPPPRFVYGLEFNGNSWVRFLGLLMFLRAYMFLRLFRDFSDVYINRHWAERCGQLPARYVGTLLSVKALLRTKPLTVMVTCVATTIVTFSYCVHVVERESRLQGHDVSIDSPMSAVYFVIITLTTVGYGDMLPSTQKGYWVSILESMWGMVVTALLVGVVISKLELSQKEELILDWVRSQTNEREHKAHAASIIGIVVRAWLVRVKRRRDGFVPMTFGNLVKNTADHLRHFHMPTVSRFGLGVDDDSQGHGKVRFHFGLFKRLKRHMKAMREYRFRLEVESDVNVYSLYTRLVHVQEEQVAHRAMLQEVLQSVDNLAGHVAVLARNVQHAGAGVEGGDGEEVTLEAAPAGQTGGASTPQGDSGEGGEASGVGGGGDSSSGGGAAAIAAAGT